MTRSRLFGAFVALVIGACLACSQSGSGSESNFVECTTDADCDSGACINERCEAPPIASSTDGGGAAGTDSGGSGGTAGSGGAGGAGGSAGMFGTGGIVAGDAGLAAGVAEPCSIDTFYIGDEFCILPPSPDVGFQVHFGPTSYDDATLSPFLFGDAIIDADDCFYVKSPNTTDAYVGEYHLRARPSAAHIEVRALSTAHADGLASCEAGFDYSPLVGTPWSITSEDFPDRAEAPENADLATRIAPNTQLAIRLRSIQTSTEPLLLREAWVNFIYKDPAVVTSEVAPLMLVAGTTTQVPVASSQVVRGSCTAPANLRILDLLARSHVPTMSFGPGGERATVWKVSGTARTLVYEAYGFEFARLYYDSVHQNPQPDRASFTSGGHNGVLDLAQGETLEWECEIINSTGRALQYSETSPACVIYGRFAPSSGGTWSCISP